MKRGYGGSKVAAPIWNAFMREALAPTSIELFQEIPEIKTDKPVLNGVEGGGVTVKINRVTGRRASSSTPEHLIVEKQFIQPHSILHYVDTEDPQGKDPKDPSVDSQYQIWEDAITDWVKRKQEEDPEWEVSFGEPPTDTDDEYSLELIPSLEVIYPAPGTVLSSRQIDTDIRASAPRGVSQVIYKIDGAPIDVVRSHPFNLNYNAQSLISGPHVLEVIVEDDIGNRFIEEIPFVLDAGEVKPSLTFSESKYNLKNSQFPVTLLFSNFEISKINAATLIAKNKNTQEIKTLESIGNLNNIFDDQLIFSWANSPGEGEWFVSIEIETTSGEIIVSDVVDVSVR
jgi:hypothetical protein